MKERIITLKGKIGDKIGKKAVTAAFTALASAAPGLLLCTLCGGAASMVITLLPLWTFVLFAVLYFVLDMIPVLAKKWWIKPLALAGTALVAMLLTALFR